jgi:hypothetical protein
MNIDNLSVIREESTARMQPTTDKGYADIDEETTTIRTNRVTARDEQGIIYEEEGDSKYEDSSHLDS